MPKKNLTFGRNIPTQGNISLQDMFDYLPDNYQDMERPDVPVQNDIYKRYYPEMAQIPSVPLPRMYQSGGGKAIDAPLQKLLTMQRVTDYGNEDDYRLQMIRNGLMRTLLPLWNGLMRRQLDKSQVPLPRIYEVHTQNG